MNSEEPFNPKDNQFEDVCMRNMVYQVEIIKLKETITDLEKRIGDASITLYDYDGYYDEKTKKGSVEGLASVIKDAYTMLQGRFWE